MTDSETAKLYSIASQPINISAEYKKAIQFHQAGQLQAAEAIYKKILEIQPSHPDSLHYLGVIAHQSGKMQTQSG